MEEPTINKSTAEYIVHETISIISQDDIKMLLNNPVWESVIHHLTLCGILIGVQYEEGKTSAVLHMSVPFDIQNAVLSRQKDQSGPK